MPVSRFTLFRKHYAVARAYAGPLRSMRIAWLLTQAARPPVRKAGNTLLRISMPEKNFTFNLGQSVTVTVSGETGTVRGRAEYLNAEDNYLVLYKSADGRAVEGWWPASTLGTAGAA